MMTLTVVVAALKVCVDKLGVELKLKKLLLGEMTSTNTPLRISLKK